MKVRLLTTGYKSAYENMAMDEAVLIHAQKNHQSTLRFYGWKPSAISIGYFQSLKEEVDLVECKKQQVVLSLSFSPFYFSLTRYSKVRLAKA